MIRKGLIARKKKIKPTELATTGPLEASSQKKNHTESWGFSRRSQSSEKVKEGCSKKREQHMQRFRRNSTWLPPQCSRREQQKSLGKRPDTCQRFLDLEPPHTEGDTSVWKQFLEVSSAIRDQGTCQIQIAEATSKHHNPSLLEPRTLSWFHSRISD